MKIVDSLVHVLLIAWHRLLGTQYLCEGCPRPRAATRYHILIGQVCQKCYEECKRVENAQG